MSKKYTVTHTETNERGHKVITKITTEDEELVKSMLGKPKKDFMNAEFKESTTKSKKSKQERKLPVPALPAPNKNTKKKESKLQ